MFGGVGNCAAMEANSTPTVNNRNNPFFDKNASTTGNAHGYGTVPVGNTFGVQSSLKASASSFYPSNQSKITTAPRVNPFLATAAASSFFPTNQDKTVSAPRLNPFFANAAAGNQDKIVSAPRANPFLATTAANPFFSSNQVETSLPSHLGQPTLATSGPSNFNHDSKVYRDNRIGMQQHKPPQQDQSQQQQQHQQQPQQRWNASTEVKANLKSSAEKEKELREMLQQKKQDLMDKVAERDRMYKRLDENASKALVGDSSTSSQAGDKSGHSLGLLGSKSANLPSDVKVTYEDDDEGEGEGEGEGEEDWIGDTEEDQVEEEEEDVDNSLNVSITSDHHPPLAFTPPPFEVPYSTTAAHSDDVSSNSKGKAKAETSSLLCIA